MLFKIFCSYLAKIEKTAKRLEMMEIFQDLFKNDLYEGQDNPIHDKIIYLCQGKLYPDWYGKPELNVAKALAKKAAALATGYSSSRIDIILKKAGDLGTTLAYLKKKGKQSKLVSFDQELTISEVYNTLVEIAVYEGTESQMKKVRTLSSLISKCSAIEAKYLGRFINSKMRLGTADLTMIDAIARLLASDEKDQKVTRAVIERAYNIYPDLGLVIKTAMLDGINALESFKPTFGIPIRSMLAQRLDSATEFLEKHGGPFAAEYKLDGERVQIHKNGDEVILFSRRQEVITTQFPDVVEYIQKFIKATKVILDGEIVAIDPDTGKLERFQILMQRRRKYDVEQKVKEIPTRVYLFDIMLKDDDSLLTTPYIKRRDIIENTILSEGNEGNVIPVNQRVVSSYEELVEFYNKAIDDGTEGLLTKSIKPESIYQPGARGWLWIKLKSLTRGKLSDHLDLVVIGANMGEGRRSGLYGTLLVAALNEETGNFEMVTKVSSGMTDETADYFYNTLTRTNVCPKTVRSNEEPDQWLVPDHVLEIAGDEITESKDSVVGYSIRFPRILRIRKDKGIEDITTVKEIRAMS